MQQLNLPKFTLPDSDGNIRDNEEFSRDWLVLYFYPKDNTSGCTLEAQDFIKFAKDFLTKSCQIVGVSKDSVKSHKNFCQKHGINYTLLSDEQGHLCEDMGVWVEKSMYGRKYMGVERSSFLFHNGKLMKEWRKVKVAGHVKEILASIA